jgi:hypothetical protein
MLYLLWALLNIGLFLFFVAACVKATRLVREHFGLLTAIIFAVGLLSFVSGSGRKNKSENGESTPSWTFAPEETVDRNGRMPIKAELEKTPVSRCVLTITYGKDRQTGANVPVRAFVGIEGLISGIAWDPAFVIVNPTEEAKRFEYYVSTTVEWKLLGATVYSQPKEYKGFVTFR